MLDLEEWFFNIGVILPLPSIGSFYLILNSDCSVCSSSFWMVQKCAL